MNGYSSDPIKREQSNPNVTPSLVDDICQLIDAAKQNTATAINTEIDNLYQQTGQVMPASKLSIKSPEVLNFLGLIDPDPPKNLKDAIFQDLGQYFSRPWVVKNTSKSMMMTFTSTCCSITANSNA